MVAFKYIDKFEFTSKWKNSILYNYYRPQTKLREGNVFTGVFDCLVPGRCLVLGRSGPRGDLVQRWSGPEGVPGPRGCLVPGGLVWGVLGPGGGLVLGGCLIPGGLVRAVHGPVGGLVPVECLVETPLDSYFCGRYASYWNAFLYFIELRSALLLNIYKTQRSSPWAQVDLTRGMNCLLTNVSLYSPKVIQYTA